MLSLLGSLQNFDILQWISRIIVLLIAFPFHESAHGYIAYKLGDPTAKNLGRITMNPIKHMSLIGTISMILVGIGWGKPVPIDPRYFKNRKAGMAISSAAGPLSNFLLAFLSMLLMKIFDLVAVLFPQTFLIQGTFGYTLYYSLTLLLFYMVFINISLGIFNLLPVPPFDGSRILFYFLPERYYFMVMRYEQFIFIAILLVLMTGALDAPLSFLTNAVYNGFDFLTGFMDLIIRAVA